VLDALARADAKATFFVLGACVERSPELLERVLTAGHAVELHGHAHLRHTRHTFDVVERDLLSALRVLRERGVEPAKWRLPWGDLADYSLALAAEHGLTLAGWTADSHDWRGDAAEAMFAALELAPGGVVLMHDGVGSGARRPDCRETARLIGPLVDAIRARGSEPGPLPGRLPMGNPDFG
jgi:peptidoglycan-N-acetylglucosamine deacetylase